MDRRRSLDQASMNEDGRLRTVNPSMWTTDENLGSDRPSHGQIRTLDQAYNFKVDEWTDFFIMDRPTHGRNRTIDRDYHFEVDEWADF